MDAHTSRRVGMLAIGLSPFRCTTLECGTAR